MSILWTIIIGFIAGVIAKLIHSGPNEPTDFLHARPKAAHGSRLIAFQPTAIVLDQASLGRDSRYSGSRVPGRVRTTYTHGGPCGIAVWNVGASARRPSLGFLG